MISSKKGMVQRIEIPKVNQNDFKDYITRLKPVQKHLTFNLKYRCMDCIKSKTRRE